MDPASAQNVNNYRLKGPRGGVVAFVSASYDPAAHTVTLKPKKHVNFHVYYTLTINGVTSAAVTSASGLTLDGMKTGASGQQLRREAAILLAPSVHPDLGNQDRYRSQEDHHPEGPQGRHEVGEPFAE